LTGRARDLIGITVGFSGNPDTLHRLEVYDVKFSELLQDFFIGLGVDWVLYLLVLLSVISLAFILERWIFYYRRRVAPDQARKLVCGAKDGIARDSMEVHVAGILLNDEKKYTDREDAESAIDTELRKQKGRYEKGLTFLATLGNNAPFVGLLGTVLGIMAAFFQLSAIGETTQKNELLMTSISEALVATAMGLIVAIPAVMFYNIFRRKVSAAVEQTREVATGLIHRKFGGGEDGWCDTK
jgi:biopolymer transport protein ExbB/TolQ